MWGMLGVRGDLRLDSFAVATDCAPAFPTSLSKPFYVSTPIYYVNASPHIGHAYTNLIADVFHRTAHLYGHKSVFSTGTDEHGQKVRDAAVEAGKTPQEFVDVIANEFETSFRALGFQYTTFIRTTAPEHVERVRKLWEVLRERDHIYWGTHEGWYSVSDEAWVVESSVADAPDGKGGKISTETGKPVTWHSETNFMFRLSAFQDAILAHYEAHPDAIVPSFRLEEIKTFVAGGLRDVSLSRLASVNEWAVDIPGDSRDHKIYVWFDALINYLTVSEPAGAWPADVQVLGKDIMKFHCVYWPAFLMGAGLPVPSKFVCHGWWTKDGAKISKSTGNTFEPAEKAAEYSTDALRYYLLRESSFVHDPDYSDDRMIERINFDLANAFGNLLNRACGAKLTDGKVGTFTPSLVTVSDKELMRSIGAIGNTLWQKVMRDADLQGSLEYLWGRLHDVNAYLQDGKPWKGTPRATHVMYIVQESLRIIATAMQAFLPNSAQSVLDTLGVEAALRSGPRAFAWGGLQAGAAVLEAPVRVACLVLSGGVLSSLPHSSDSVCSSGRGCVAS